MDEFFSCSILLSDDNERGRIVAVDRFSDIPVVDNVAHSLHGGWRRGEFGSNILVAHTQSRQRHTAGSPESMHAALSSKASSSMDTRHDDIPI